MAHFHSSINNLNMTPSYSKKGDPWNNAYIESIHALIKREWLNRVYLDYISPEAFKRQYELSETAKSSLKA